MTDHPAPAIPRAIIALNDRRLCLIEQKYRRGAGGRPSGLTAAEQEELNACARAVGAWVEGEAAWAGRREPSAGGPPCPVRRPDGER